MGNISNLFGGAFLPPKQEIVRDAIEQIRDAIESAGLNAPDTISVDGNIHRFSTNGKSGDDAGWYVFYPDDIVCGCFGCWRDNVQVNFKQNIGRQLSAIENMQITKRLNEAKQRREAEQARKHNQAAETAEQIWQNAGNASDEHPYLVKKGVSNHGLRITGDGRLIVPLYDEDGELSTLQYIPADGSKKRFQADGKSKGGSFVIGSKRDTVYIAEGYATAASIHEVTGMMCIVAFSAGNLKPIAMQTRSRLGATANIVIVGDNDVSGTGQEKAKEAASAIGARYVVPPTVGDANDYQAAGYNLLELLAPKQDDWLIPADSFSEQPAPIAWLVKHWLQRDALIMVHGPSGGGKTFTVLDMALRIASGMPSWNGHRVTQGAVVYLAGEGHHGLRGRIAAWKHHHQQKSLNMWLSKAGCDLNTSQGIMQVIDAVSALPEKPCMIIVDTLHRFLHGDENSAQDAKEMLDACAVLMAQFNCSVLLVHHTGVSEEAQHRARGSSAWRGALDIEISVIPPKGDDSTMQIVQRKSKDAEIAQSIYAELKSVVIPGWVDEDGEPVTSAVLIEGQAPVESKKDSKLMESVKLFERCWFHSGAELDANGNPYLTASAGRDALIAIAGLKETTAKNYMKMSYGKGMIYDLVTAGILSANEHGFSVTDDTYASSFLLKK